MRATASLGVSQQPFPAKALFWAADMPPARGPVQMLQPAPRAIPRPPSMLFDLEMEELAAVPKLDSEAQQAVVAAHSIIGQSVASCEVVRDVERACQQVNAQGKSVCTQALAEALSQLGYSVAIRESLGGGSGGQCLRNLRHSFLCCMPEQRSHTHQPHTANISRSSGVIIVDPTFRDQFDIAHKTLRYSAVIDALPAVLVCNSSKIQTLVELLCAEMSLAFHSTGTVLPPWRYTKSMLSKWQPRQSVDLSLLPGRQSGKQHEQQLPYGGHPLPPMAAPAVVRSSLLFRNVRAVSEASGSDSSTSTCCLAGGKCQVSNCSTAAPDSSATSDVTSMACQSGSSGNQVLLASKHQQHNAQHHQQQRQGQPPPDGRSEQFRDFAMFPCQQAGFDAGVVPVSTATHQMLPVRRHVTFEPLRRVVGGFAASFGSGAQSAMLAAAQ